MELFSGYTGNAGTDGHGENKLKGFTPVWHRETYGKMKFQYFVGEGFQIWHSHYQMNRSMEFVSVAGQPILELHIPLAVGAVTYSDGQCERPFRPLQFDLEYAPFLKSSTQFGTGPGSATLDLHYHPEFLYTYIDSYPAIGKFLGEIEKGRRTSLLGDAVRFLNPVMHRVVREILASSGDPDYYADRAAVLLELALERAERLRPVYTPKKDIEAVMAVRALIETNPHYSYTAAELSAYTGISVSKLHNTFRELQGTTLFDFSQGIRLDHARVLLADTRYTLQEIGEQCGYPEHPNFTTAFKRRFGMAPAIFRSRL